MPPNLIYLSVLINKWIIQYLVEIKNMRIIQSKNKKNLKITLKIHPVGVMSSDLANLNFLKKIINIFFKIKGHGCEPC